MSASSLASSSVSVASRSSRSLPAWAREPLLHFVVLGALLFAIDHALFTRGDDPHLIVIGADADREAQQVFVAARGRAPNGEEMSALRGVWLNNEVLYREGLAMQVDKGDRAIRDRVVFKALSVIDAGVSLPPADDATLRRYFEAHRDHYDEPARYDFEEAVLSGDVGEAPVRAFAGALNAGLPGDAKAGLRVFKGRPDANLDQSFGEGFARALAGRPVGEWTAMSTRDGWRAIRLDAVAPSRLADFAVVRNTVQMDWADATAAEQRTAAVRALTKKYKVRIEAER